MIVTSLLSILRSPLDNSIASLVIIINERVRFGRSSAGRERSAAAEKIGKRGEGKLENYIKDTGPKDRINFIDFEQIYRRFCRRKLFPNVPSHPTTSVDTLFNSMVLDFPSQQPAVRLQLQTATAVSNNDAVPSKCPSPRFFHPVSPFRRLTGENSRAKKEYLQNQPVATCVGKGH